MLTRKNAMVLSLIAIIGSVILIANITIKGPTKIDDIKKHPDRYIGKRVTIIGTRGHYIMDPLSTFTTYGNLKGFWISGKESGLLGPSAIFVKYTGNPPPHRVKDKWGRTILDPDLRVTGIVSHTRMVIGVGEKKGVIYIDGESWKYVDSGLK